MYNIRFDPAHHSAINTNSDEDKRINFLEIQQKP